MWPSRKARTCGAFFTSSCVSTVGPRQEGRDVAIRKRGDRAIERRAAQARVQPRGAAALEANLRAAVGAVGQRQHVTRDK